MASISCTQFKRTGATASDHGTWNGWYSASSAAYLMADNHYGYLATMLIRGDIDYTGAVSINGASITLTLKRNSASAMSNYTTVDCYVYTYEPSAPSTSVPGGYIDSTSVYVPKLSAYQEYTVTFSLSFSSTASQSLYFLLVNDRTEGINGYLPSSSSGSFDLSPVTMSLSSTSVTTGNNQVATFTNGSGRSVSVSVKFNNTALWTGSTTSGSLTIPVTKSWFTTAGITTSQQFSVSIQATETYTGTIYDSFYVVAGSDMNPTVGTPTVSIVQAAGKPTANFPNTYLASISKAKVAASVSSGSNASIASVVLTYTGGAAITMTYNSSTGKYEATTSALVSASTTFTATATDSRGMSAASTSSAVTVEPYVAPSVSVDAGATFRCDQNGTQDSGGTHFMAKAAATYTTSLTGNALDAFFVKVQGTQTEYNLTSNVQTAPLNASLAPRTNYTLEFVIEDKVSEAITKTFPLGSQVRDIVAIHNSTGTALGVGTTPQRTAGSSVELPMGGDFLAGGFPWGSLTVLNGTATDGSSFSRNFLNVEVNTRYAAKNATAAFDKPASDSGWSNIPSSKVGVAFGGIREVLWVSGSCIMVKIMEFYPYSGVIWTNYYNGSAWAGWRYNS